VNKIYLAQLFSILLLFSACAEDERSEIINEVTTSHINVPGTKTSLIPPNDFTISYGFTGFEQALTGSSIMVIEMPASYSETIKEMTPAGFASQGVTELSREEFSFNSMRATLIHAEQSAYATIFEKVILFFGDDNNSIMITGMTPQGNAELMDEIEKSILTTVYEADLEIDKEAALTFSLDLTDSKFQFGEMMILSAIYTVDGKVPTEGTDKSSILIGKSFTELEITDPKAFAIERLDQLPSFMERDPESVEKIQIDGMEGIEIVSYQKNENTLTLELIYQVMLFEGYEYFLIVGTAKADFESNLEEFKRVSKTFTRN
jgi:hypothetical protein